ncbi:ABC transporter permease [Teichococcus wenyumeiae]|uniref:ABC transporter permease n=1 Tax=Teichococcus wenyumeiae TaxID=2478470 RepID=UPI001F46BBC1|nr:ABC transporter permease subunit [Pseudoroseomonas wenyumeiae]
MTDAAATPSPAVAIPREATAAALLAALAAVLPFLLGWLSVAPNRLVSPRPVALPMAAAALPLGLFLLCCLGVALLARRRALLPWAEAVAGLALLALLATLGLGAGAALEGASRLARVAPGAGVWFSALALLLAGGCCAAGRGRMADATPTRFLAVALPGLALLVASGLLDPLSLLKEAAQRGPELRLALLRHAVLAAGALTLAAAVAVPLSLLALRRPRLEAALMTLANGLQVVPSIALFGLLMAPLAGLAAMWPPLRAAGIGGIGAAPAVIGIAAYLLLPLAAGMLAGLRQAPPELIDAARGQGMNERAILRHLRVPLGLGAMLGGLRVAAVQAVGLATLAALVGAGGLGAIVFQGIGQLAADLILLGVLPVVALSLCVDALLAAAQRLLMPPGTRA